MNKIELLTKQTEDAYEWANKLIRSIPKEKHDNIPEILETSVNWQMGHLILSFYYHSIMVIKGHQMDVLQKVPLKEYNQFFMDTSPGNTIGKVDSSILWEQLLYVEGKSLEIIKSLSLDELEIFLEPASMPHPIAKVKWEALDWNIKHTMWHCGQLGILKRLLDERYDFGLRKK